MKDFVKFDLDISKIVLAVKVISSSDHQKTHINRPSHGLALHLGGHKIYHFEDGHDLEVFKDDIIFIFLCHSEQFIFGEICSGTTDGSNALAACYIAVKSAFLDRFIFHYAIHKACKKGIAGACGVYSYKLRNTLDKDIFTVA